MESFLKDFLFFPLNLKYDKYHNDVYRIFYDKHNLIFSFSDKKSGYKVRKCGKQTNISAHIKFNIQFRLISLPLNIIITNPC
ncbi:hypothetical protein ASG21_16780 [Chryseobacterium sp. Leaf394]|nr:hypothetical protein ASG21_16780 [Chryseobacterium sp. Leaf394]